MQMHTVMLTPQLSCQMGRSAQGNWLGICDCPTGAGNVRLTMSVDESVLAAAMRSQAARALQQLLLQRQNGAVSGSIFDKAFKTIKRVGRGVGNTVSNLARLRLKKALRSAVSTAQAASPLNLVPGGARLQRQALQLARQAAPFVPGAGPLAALAITPQKLAAAQRFMSAAQRGAPKARAAVHRITARARAGDARAKRIAALLLQAAKLMQGSGGGAVAGAAFGRWQTTPGGQQVFVPDVQSSGAGMDYLLSQLRPRLGYRRDTADVLTMRKAIRRGQQAMAARSVARRYV